jgi:cation/acetate symporter
MDVQAWTFVIVGLTFALYIGIAIRSRAGSTGEFYVAGKGVSPLANGMATAADWMSAASFISMAGIIAFEGMDGSVYLMGWTGGYVLLALLLAPYLRKFGKFTVPDFMGDRYASQYARLVAIICAIFISFTYVAGQMRGVGVVFSRFLEVDINLGVVIGMGLVFFYAVLGGMKGITYTQVAQYCVLIFAYTVPAVFLAFMVTGNPVPQTALGGMDTEGVGLLDKLNGMLLDLGFGEYTEYTKSPLDVVCITAALMLGTAGLPHVIIRFYTVKTVRGARSSAGWALLFIAILYTTAPAIAVFARTNLLATVPNVPYAEAPSWLGTWEDTGLVAWLDKNHDGVIQHAPGGVFASSPANGEAGSIDAVYSKKPVFRLDDAGESVRGDHGERAVSNVPDLSNPNELHVDRDIMVLANPEISGLPDWVVALVAAGGLAAALSTAAGLLMVISSAVSHDLFKRMISPDITEKSELRLARFAAAIAVLFAGYLGVNPPDYVAAVVAFAFGLAASSFFPAILLGIFWKRMNAAGAVSGMLVGIIFTTSYIIWFKFMHAELNTPGNWWFGISPEGIGTIGMLLNFAIAIPVALITKPPSAEVQALVDSIRIPAGAGEAHELSG